MHAWAHSSPNRPLISLKPPANQPAASPTCAQSAPISGTARLRTPPAGAPQPPLLHCSLPLTLLYPPLLLFSLPLTLLYCLSSR